MNGKTLTVVFEINDDEAFKPLFDQIKSVFLCEGNQPYRAYCLSCEDEPHRVQLMHEASQHPDYRGSELADVIEEIWQNEDIRKFEDFAAFLKKAA